MECLSLMWEVLFWLLVPATLMLTSLALLFMFGDMSAFKRRDRWKR
jgi:hypothetical protein